MKRIKPAVPEWASVVARSPSTLLQEIYGVLFQAFGPRHWWPGETPFEVMVGAVLTQNTSWTNVEKAIRRLKQEGCLDMERIHRLKNSELASMIRSSGFFRIKAVRLKALVDFLIEGYHGEIEKMKKEPLRSLREKLLRIKGVGPETADSILLYGLGKPVFVVDAYTKRVLSRHGVISEKASYERVQRLFMDELPRRAALFNEYHALLVHLGKHFCRKVPRCEICPLRNVRREA